MDGQEVLNLLAHRAIANVIVMGVHTNVCILSRPTPPTPSTGIRAATAGGRIVTSDQLVGGTPFRFAEDLA